MPGLFCHTKMRRGTWCLQRNSDLVFLVFCLHWLALQPKHELLVSCLLLWMFCAFGERKKKETNQKTKAATTTTETLLKKNPTQIKTQFRKAGIIERGLEIIKRNFIWTVQSLVFCSLFLQRFYLDLQLENLVPFDLQGDEFLPTAVKMRQSSGLSVMGESLSSGILEISFDHLYSLLLGTLAVLMIFPFSPFCVHPRPLFLPS